MTNTKCYDFKFDADKQAWLALEPVHFAFALVSKKSAVPCKRKCCALHYEYRSNCTYAVSQRSLPDAKPFLAVYCCFGYGGQVRFCDQKISDLLDRKAISSVDCICYRNGEWLGVGSADCAFYKGFNFRDVPAAEFLKLIDIKFNILEDYGSGVFNFYKFIFIAFADAADPREIYEEYYASVPGLYNAMSRMNLVHSLQSRFRGEDCFRWCALNFAGEPSEYEDYMRAVNGDVLKIARDASIHKSWLGSKRKRDASSASKFKVEKGAK